MRRFSLFLFLLAALGSAIADDWRVRQVSPDNFADTRDAIVMAIENKGLVINYTGRIGEMLDRTAADLGAARRLYENAEVIEFCSASLSRQMMEADPHDIVNCPFTIAVYTLTETGNTWVAYRKSPGNSSRALEKLLRDIVAEAVR